MATLSSILVWRIPWTEEPGGLHTVHGVAESYMTDQVTLSVHFSFFFFFFFSSLFKQHP